MHRQFFRLAIAAVAVATPVAYAHDVGIGPQPLGDGKVSSEPKVGYLWSCRTNFGGGVGAHRLGPWARDGVWHPKEKITVRGAVNWPNASISLAVEGAQRVVRANGLPKHATGVFPIGRDDPAYQFDRNPNAIAAQTALLRLPAVPVAAAKPSCVPMGMIGFALTGVAIFNAVDAAGRDAPAYEIQDACSGHPERGGTYHYHDYSACMTDEAGKAGRHSDLVGYALDGYGIFGPKGEGGKRLHNADLDACHGHTHEVAWDGEKRTIYHYHFTDEYPYSIGCFAGTPVNQPQGGPGGPPPGGGPDQVLAVAARELGVDVARLRAAIGPPPPDFARAARELGLPEARIRNAMQRARAGR